MNSAVTVLFTKSPASWFLALPGTIPPFHRSICEAFNGERPLGVVPAAGMLVTNSTIHKAAGSLVTGIPVAGTTPRGHSPIDSFTDGTVKWWNSTRQSQEP